MIPQTLASSSSYNQTLALYRGSPKARKRDVAQEAYQDAVEFLRERLKDDAQGLKLLDGATTATDFKREVEKVKESYEARRPNSRCVSVLRKLSSRILYYSKVMDVLAQHHPEYVSLAWGAVKFVLMGIINHEKLVTHFSGALVEIGGALRGAKLSAELYPTEQMKEAISHLYAHIILFFQQAVKWYTKSRVGRTVSAFVNPAELEYEETVQQIRFHAEVVKDLSTGATSVEIRDIHVLLQLHQGKLHEMQENMKKMSKSLEEKASLNLQVATATKSLTSRVSTSINDIHPRIIDIQFASILDVLRPNQLPATALSKIQSINDRAALSTVQLKNSPSTPALMASLHAWASTPGSSLFVVRVGPRAEMKAREFATDTISVLKEKKFAVLFAVSESTPLQDGLDVSLTMLLKSLIFQALQRFPSILSDDLKLSVAKFADDHSEAEWRALLFEIFAKITHCFVVIDAQDLGLKHKGNEQWLMAFMLLWQELIEQAERNGKAIKILTVSNVESIHHTDRALQGSTASAEEANLDGKTGPHNRIMSIVQAPTPIPPRLRKGTGPAARREQLLQFRLLNPGF